MAWRTIQDEIADPENPASVAIPVWLAENATEALPVSGAVAYLDGTEPTWSSHPENAAGWQAYVTLGSGATEVKVAFRYSTATATEGGAFLVSIDTARQQAFAEITAAASTTPKRVEGTLTFSAPLPQVQGGVPARIWVGWRSDVGLRVSPDPFVTYAIEQAVYYERTPTLTPGKSHYLLELESASTGGFSSTGGARRYHVCRCEDSTANADGVMYVWPRVQERPPLVPNQYDSTKGVFAGVYPLGVCILHGWSWASREPDIAARYVAWNHRAMLPSVIPSLASTAGAGTNLQRFVTVAPVNAPEGFGARDGGTISYLWQPRRDAGSITVLFHVASLSGVPTDLSVDVSLYELPSGGSWTTTVYGTAPAAPVEAESQPGLAPPTLATALWSYNIGPDPAEWGAADSIGASDPAPGLQLAATIADRFVTTSAYEVRLTPSVPVWIPDVRVSSQG